MAASNGYRPMLGSEHKPEYGYSHTDLVVVDYDTHPRYGRGTVLHRSTGKEVHVVSDSWKGIHPNHEEIHAEITGQSEPGPEPDPEFEKFKKDFTPLITNEDGEPSLEKALNELYDYWRRSEALNVITREIGMSDDRLYYPSAIKGELDRHISEVVDQNITDILDVLVNRRDLVVLQRVTLIVNDFGSDKLKAAWAEALSSG